LGQGLPKRLAVRVPADPAHHAGGRSGQAGGHGLIGSLPAGRGAEPLAHDGGTRGRQDLHVDRQIHVEAADDQHFRPLTVTGWGESAFG